MAKEGQSESRNLIIFYDAPCIDGAGSAWCFDKKYSKDDNVTIDFVPLAHGDPEAREKTIMDALSEGDEVYFVDTSPKDEELTKLLSPCDQDNDDKKPKQRIKSVKIWDHHASEKWRMESYKPPVIKDYEPPLLKINIDTKQPAAALMVWEKLFPDTDPPEFLGWIGKMEPPSDLNNEKEKAVAAFIDSKDIGSLPAIRITFNALAKMTISDMVSPGRKIADDQANNIAKMRRNVMYTRLELLPEMGEMWIPIVNADVQNFGRSVSQALIEEGQLGTTVGVSAAWFVQGDGSVKLSIRTTGKPNAARIAKHLGEQIGADGGGHNTDAVTEFKDLQKFAEAVQLYTKDKMLAKQWERPPATPAIKKTPKP